ncbi:MFS transporter [Actinopolymorpha sp. NPDC004070]|uniref:MFS transporter n=1 Tax=Actinopolymorpha sp. NPDC004070 TaxID=3154548 RepID=UPI0033AEB284
MIETFRSLRNRNYRLYAAGSAVSNTGTWLQRVAQDWLVLELTHNSGTALGITTGLQFLPFLLVAPFGGLIADRFSKRKVLQCTQVAMGITAAALALLDLTGVVTVWHVYLIAFLFGVASAVDNPARQSFVVEMVGKEDLPNAVGLNSASFNGARVIGPALAGLLIVLVGTGWVILINAITYAATIIALARMRSSELQTAAPVPRKPGMVRDGVQYVRGRPDLMLVLWVVFFVGCFGLNFQMTSALMATEVFGKGAGEYGVLGSIVAVGAVIGALRAARTGRPRLRIVLVAAVIFGILEALNGLAPTYLTFALMLPFLGFAQLTMITAANAMMQLSVSPEMRGRVISLYSMVFIGSTPFGAPIVGWVGQTFGARWTLIGGGLISLFGTLGAALILTHRQGLVMRAHLRPRPHLHFWWTQQRPEATAAGLPADAAAPEGGAEDEVVTQERPIDVEPVGPEPVGPEPVDAEPVSAEPVSAEPVRGEPVGVRAEASAPDGPEGRGDPHHGGVRRSGHASGEGRPAAVVPPRSAVRRAPAPTGERVPAWSSVATTRCSGPTPQAVRPWRTQVSARQSRRGGAGRSATL